MKGQGFRSSPGGRGGTPQHPCSTGLRRRRRIPAYGSSKGGVRPDRPACIGPQKGPGVASGSGRTPPAESSGRSSTPLRPVPPPDRPAMRPPPSLDPYHNEARQQDREELRASAVARSEEHTSELQSLAYLVCRLLLEKKKKEEQPCDSRDTRVALQ